MKQVILILISVCTIALNSCKQPSVKTPQDNYRARVFQSEIDQFGYDIYKDSVVIIHQPIIPGVAGNKGFATKEDAQKVADLMVYKMKNKIEPPSISAKELDSLKVKIGGNQ